MSFSEPPQAFLKKLRETIAWCVSRVDASNPKYCLRSADLKPVYEFSPRPEDDVNLWASVEMIEKVVDSRAQLLSTATVGPGAETLAGGRLLLHFLDQSDDDQSAADITSCYLDSADTPPWDTWVDVYVPESLAHQSPDSIPTEYGFLISWVPREFVETVNEATEYEVIGMLMWADAPRRFDEPRDFARSIPLWLEQLR